MEMDARKDGKNDTALNDRNEGKEEYCFVVLKRGQENYVGDLSLCI